MITPICAWMLVTKRASPLHLNVGSQYSNSLLRVDAGGLLLGSDNLQDYFFLRLDSKIGPSVSEDCYNLAQFFIIFRRVRKICEERLMASSCLRPPLSPSVCPHGTTRLPLDEFS
jgi:hypothetical protein